MEVREQSAGVGSLSTMWDLGIEFRLSSLVASIFTYWAISQVPVRKFLNEPAFLFFFNLHVCVYALRMCIWALPLTCEYVRSEVNVKSPLLLLSNLPFEAGSLPESGALRLLVSILLPPPPRARIMGTYIAYWWEIWLLGQFCALVCASAPSTQWKGQITENYHGNNSEFRDLFWRGAEFVDYAFRSAG